MAKQVDGHDAGQFLAANKFAERERAGAVGDASVACNQRCAAHLPALRRAIDQHLARGRCRTTEYRCHPGRRQGSEGPGIPGHEGRVGHDHGHDVQSHVQFLGDGLRQRRADVLPDLGLAGARRDPAVLADV